MSLEENPIEDSDVGQKVIESENKPAKDRKNRKDKVKPLAKVVIRRLPPTMTEEEFSKQIEPIPDHDYFYFVPADWSLGVNATCRAYINFCNQNDIFIFRDKFDGYVFVDNKGSEYPAIVEFAPFQGLPKGKSRKKDHKANTIESEPHYLAFLESLKDEESEGKSELKMEYSFQIKDDQKITSTPLLEYLANVRQARRDERKRKSEDKKQQREEEKQRKNQMAKSMQKTIEEEVEFRRQKNDDGIIVRTIKSRPMDRDRNKDKSEKGDKSEGNSRAEREKQRNKERQARRKEERERNRKEREKDKDERKAVTTDKSDADRRDSKADKDGADKVKKYSESRRDRKKRNESNQAAKSKQSKNDQKESADASDEKMDTQRNEYADDNRNNNSAAEKEARARERAITNLRNKDRPSLQIYQPGKRRTNSTTSITPTEDKCESKFNSVECSSNEGTSTEKPQSTSKNDDRKQNDGKESTKGQSDDRKKPANEKRISRYSEKRNKAKEKRDLTDNSVVASDFISENKLDDK